MSGEKPHGFPFDWRYNPQAGMTPEKARKLEGWAWHHVILAVETLRSRYVKNHNHDRCELLLQALGELRRCELEEAGA